MKVKMTYRDGIKYDNQNYDIPEDEANVCIETDYENRLSEAPEEEKKNIKRRTLQEILDVYNKQEESFNKANMREKSKLVSSTVYDDDNDEVSRLDLIPDKNTLSPLEACLVAEELELENHKNQSAKEALYAKLTKIQLRRFEMQLEGMTISQIAEIEGVKYNSIKDSFDLIKAKIEKLFPKVPQKGPENVHYSVGELFVKKF